MKPVRFVRRCRRVCPASSHLALPEVPQHRRLDNRPAPADACALGTSGVGRRHPPFLRYVKSAWIIDLDDIDRIAVAACHIDNLFPNDLLEQVTRGFEPSTLPIRQSFYGSELELTNSDPWSFGPTARRFL